MLVVDGNSVYHRAWHAYRASGIAGRDQQPAHAVYGFFALTAGIIAKTSPTRVIIGFDSPHNDRRVRWPHYKANRAKRDPDLAVQLAATIRTAEQLGLTVSVHDGAEADDVCASTAAAATRAQLSTVIATSDRDAFALVSQHVTVMRLTSGLNNATFIDPAALHNTVGVHPHQYLPYAALRGDSSDNLPGVAGFGPKTAAKLLAATDVETALRDPQTAANTLGEAAAHKLSAGAQQWRHNMEVMAMRTDLPVDLDAATLRLDPTVVAETFRNLGLPTLTTRWQRLRAEPW